MSQSVALEKDVLRAARADPGCPRMSHFVPPEKDVIRRRPTHQPPASDNIRRRPPNQRCCRLARPDGPGDFPDFPPPAPRRRPILQAAFARRSGRHLAPTDREVLAMRPRLAGFV